MAARDIDNITLAEEAKNELADRGVISAEHAQQADSTQMLDTIIADPYVMERVANGSMPSLQNEQERDRDAQHAVTASAVAMSASQRFGQFSMTVNGKKFDGKDAAEHATWVQEHQQKALNDLVEQGYSYEEAENYVERMNNYAEPLNNGRMPEDAATFFKENTEKTSVIEEGRADRDQQPNNNSKKEVENMPERDAQNDTNASQTANHTAQSQSMDLPIPS